MSSEKNLTTMPKSYLNNHVVRGLRNNNPGNLVKTRLTWVGKLQKGNDSRFEQFEALKYGIRAQMMDVINDIKKGKNTLTKLIHEYAPSFENDTTGYINNVAKSVNIKPNEVIKTIDTKFILSLSRAIYKVELGKYHVDITDSDIKDGFNLLPSNLSTNTLIIKKKD
jgi:hypothetical protein